MSVTIMVLVSPPMSVTFGFVSPFFVRLMLIVPMVPVPVVMAIPDELLAGRLSPEMIEVSAVFVKMQVWLGFVDHLFMAMIEIEIMVAGR
jgi:hypothetical protein